MTEPILLLQPKAWSRWPRCCVLVWIASDGCRTNWYRRSPKPDYSACGCRAHYRGPGMGAARSLGGDRGTVPPGRLSWLLHRDRRRSQSLCRCAPSPRSIRDLPLLNGAGGRPENCARRRRRRPIPRSDRRSTVSDPRTGGCLSGAIRYETAGEPVFACAVIAATANARVARRWRENQPWKRARFGSA